MTISSTAPGRLALLMLFTVVGCNGDGDSFTPDEGQWYRDVSDASLNTCPAITSSGAFQEPFELGLDGGGLLILRDGDEFPMPCTLDGYAFTCTSEQVSPIEGIDATQTIQARWEGTFDDESSMTGEATREITCEGPDCTNIDAEWPCVTHWNFVATTL